MKRLVLHIGTHKTATTTVQDTFANNAALLRRHGLIYPRLSRFTGHHGLVTDWNRLPDQFHPPGGSRALWRGLASDFGQDGATVLVSSEELSRAHADHRVDFREVRDLVSGFDRVEVVCLLREQWQFMQSIYLELAKKIMPPRPYKLVKDALARNMCAGLWVDYNGLYDHLLTAFAPDEITFIDFDIARRAEGGVIGTLLRHLDIALDPAELKPVNNGASNVSPPALPAWAANIAAEPRVAPSWLIGAMASAFQTVFGADARSCLFTRAEMDLIRDHFAPLNARFVERVGMVQKGFGLSRTPPDREFVFRDMVKEKFWTTATRCTFAAAHDRMRDAAVHDKRSTTVGPS
ncbi:MAG: hypothetical protein ACK4KW_13520 [Gemmobacter sp.]